MWKKCNSAPKTGKSFIVLKHYRAASHIDDMFETMVVRWSERYGFEVLDGNWVGCEMEIADDAVYDYYWTEAPQVQAECLK